MPPINVHDLLDGGLTVSGTVNLITPPIIPSSAPKAKCVALGSNKDPPAQLKALVTQGRRKSASLSRCRLDTSAETCIHYESEANVLVAKVHPKRLSNEQGSRHRPHRSSHGCEKTY